MQVHGLGITEHYQGSESVMLLVNLALLIGALGRPGVGINPLRGQNNVQGAADMGCQPDLLTGYADPQHPEVRARFERIWKRPLPIRPGRTIPRMYEAIRAGDLRAMYILGEDVVQTDPDANSVVATLKQLDFLVVQELFLSPTAQLAHVVLPGASFLEKDGTFTNGERRIQRVRRVVAPPGQARPDWEVLCALMAASGYSQPFASPAEILAEVAQVSPVHAGASYDRLDGDGLQWPVPTATHPGTAILHADSFPIGRAPLSCITPLPSPAVLGRQHPLVLITGRALAHYNNGSMTRRTDNLQLQAGDALEIHPADAQHLGIVDGDRVRVRSRWGEAVATARLSARVQPGSVFLTFHFPETGTNRVTSPVTDRLAGCPEYKLTPVSVAREPGWSMATPASEPALVGILGR
jgi:predicted molibdopterin-dependent oxidoreductase YjgC